MTVCVCDTNAVTAGVFLLKICSLTQSARNDSIKRQRLCANWRFVDDVCLPIHLSVTWWICTETSQTRMQRPTHRSRGLSSRSIRRYTCISTFIRECRARQLFCLSASKYSGIVSKRLNRSSKFLFSSPDIATVSVVSDHTDLVVDLWPLNWLTCVHS